MNIIIPSIGSYADFVAFTNDLPVKGDVWFSTALSAFHALFVSKDLHVLVSFAAATTPASFSTDFPSAVQLNGSLSVSFAGGHIQASASDYSDFKFLVEQFGLNGMVLDSIDTVQGGSTVTIIALSKGLDAYVYYNEAGSSLPGSFATDFPNAISMSALSPLEVSS